MNRAGALFALCGLLVACGPLPAAEEPTRWDGSREGLSFRLTARTPEQMAAFYEGRGVVASAIAEVRRACFITGIIVNRSADILWLDLSQWRFFTVDGEAIRRFERSFWHETWRRLGVPLPNRSVFDWTQLPENRDLHPAESVGGNVSLVPPPGAFSLEARFARGPQRDRGEVVIRIDNLRCPRGEA